MNFFPNSSEEISLIKFIAKYQYLAVNDAKYFFSTVKYFRKRITRLVEQRYLKRNKLMLVLDEIGIEYAKEKGYEYNPVNRNQKYLSRLLYISNFGAYYEKSEKIEFTPSFSIKDKEMLTLKSRKYIGIINISGYEYLIYHISKIHDYKYIRSVIYDIQKELKYKNTIILIEPGVKLNINDFIFGNGQVLIIEDTEENRNKLQDLNNIRWVDIVYKLYHGKAHLAGYKFCDYTDYKHKYISYFYFFDTEKINRIKQFLAENKFKGMDILCPKEIKEELQKQIPKANYIIVDVKDYIDGKKKEDE